MLYEWLFRIKAQKTQKGFSCPFTDKNQELWTMDGQPISPLAGFPCTHPRFLFSEGFQVANSNQATLRHTQGFAYRCYLPVLAGLGELGLRRTWSSASHTWSPTRK